jgi:Tfp pilus assembly protein PilX
MKQLSFQPARGIALPIMLIMLAVMMVSSIYLLRSSTSTTLTTSNLAYDAAMTKAADAGLHAGFSYLRTVANKNDLLVNQAAAGYVATLPQNWTVSNPDFWTGSITLAPDADNNRIEYVIHRMCNFTGAYDVSPNKCQTTAPRPGTTGPRALGATLRVDAPNLNSAAQIHYVVTARVFGPRGGNVVTQAVIMKGP